MSNNTAKNIADGIAKTHSSVDIFEDDKPKSKPKETKEFDIGGAGGASPFGGGYSRGGYSPSAWRREPYQRDKYARPPTNEELRVKLGREPLKEEDVDWNLVESTPVDRGMMWFRWAEKVGVPSDLNVLYDLGVYSRLQKIFHEKRLEGFRRK